MIVLGKDELKRYVLTNYDQVDVFCEYLEISRHEIEYCLRDRGNAINNPLRIDNNPSLTFKYSTDNETGEWKLRMFDRANARYRGDCFDLAGLILGKNPRYAKEFIDICNDIIDRLDKETKPNKSRPYIPVSKDIIIQPINFNNRHWNKHDREIWSKWYLNDEDLDNGKVYPVDNAWIYSNTCNYAYSKNDPCYAYYLDTYNDVPLWKFYFPKRSKSNKERPRFITNNVVYPIECIHEMQIKDVLVLTKARKDTLLIRKLLTFLSIPFTIQVSNLTTESSVLPYQYISKLMTVYPYIFINTDNDRAGKVAALEYRKIGINGFIFDSKDPKDVSDYLEVKGFDKALREVEYATNIIQSIINNKKVC